jgi:hypothetical protein
MNSLQKALLLPLSTVSSESDDSSADGTSRLDIEFARTRINALVSQASLLTAELVSVKADVLKLLDELDAHQQPLDNTEPNHELP